MVILVISLGNEQLTHAISIVISMFVYDYLIQKRKKKFTPLLLQFFCLVHGILILNYNRQP